MLFLNAQYHYAFEDIAKIALSKKAAKLMHISFDGRPHPHSFQLDAPRDLATAITQRLQAIDAASTPAAAAHESVAAAGGGQEDHVGPEPPLKELKETGMDRADDEPLAAGSDLAQIKDGEATSTVVENEEAAAEIPAFPAPPGLADADEEGAGEDDFFA